MDDKWFKENDYKKTLKQYLYKKDRNSWHLDKNNLPPEIELNGSRENLKGQSYNGIELLYPCGYNRDRRVMYVCKCFCGTYFLSSGKNIKMGIAKSCNCLHRNKLTKRNLDSGKDIIGTKQGLLFVESIAGLSETPEKGHMELLVNCVCDCGCRCVKKAVYIRNGETQSCGTCKNRSIGERIIQRILEEKNIEYKREVSFSDLKTENGYPMRFDFYVMSGEKIVFLLEYDGNIHFEESVRDNSWNTKETYVIRHQRDLKKNEWAEANNIPLYRISYKEDIEKRLEEIFNGI